MGYLVQAILIDGEIETVVDSRKSDGYWETVRSLMARHRHSYHYCTALWTSKPEKSCCQQRKTNFNKPKHPDGRLPEPPHRH